MFVSVVSRSKKMMGRVICKELFIKISFKAQRIVLS